MDDLRIRSDPRPGDLGAILRLHGETYAREQGFDLRFEAYVAEGLARFVHSADARGRLWLAERVGELVGCVALVDAGPEVAQLRWFLVAPVARGRGLGRRLIELALEHGRAAGFARVVLWTVSSLETAAHLYRATGFALVESTPGRPWGRDVVEERYELRLR